MAYHWSIAKMRAQELQRRGQALRLNQTELAARMGTTAASISRWEAGAKNS